MDTIVADQTEIQLSMCEFKSRILPPGSLAGAQPETWVWGYRRGACPTTTQQTYLGPVIVATRGTPTQIRFTNLLGNASSTNVLAYKNSLDQTLHWADPEMLMCNLMASMGEEPEDDCAENYEGSIPAVPHLHGGEVPPVLDGGPNQWFTSDGLVKGASYYSAPGAASNEAIYRYPNKQEAASIWFHDHTLGATRLNVYAGLAAGYIIHDPDTSKLPANMPGPAQIVPIILQDRMFDTNGQLYFPAGIGAALNPEHPYWSPEFVGDVMVVNGKAWPYLNVEQRRYRFLFLNGSNARTYEMFLTNSVTKVNGPAMYQIGTDGGYLDSAVTIDPNALSGMRKLTLQPGERADIIIDFAALPVGTTLALKNTAKTPFPAGSTPTGGMDKIMQFRVVAPPNGFVDNTYNPATTPTIRTEKIVRIANNPQVTPTVKRQLTLNEVMGMGGGLYPGGPAEVLVNNTKWAGESSRSYGDFTSITPVGGGSMDSLNYSELPKEGTIEQWEIINLTADAHPIHLHLVQFQAINRQTFDVPKYNNAYAAAFPGGLGYRPGFGPPLNYKVANTDGAVGGNPAVTPFLQGAPRAPNANELGWKDTMIMYPGQVTRIMVRYAPTDTPLGVPAHYPFVTNTLDRGYVWHCHIIDHEDNEMMRPQYVVPQEGVTRTYIQGVHY